MKRQQEICRLVNVVPTVQGVEHTSERGARLAIHGVNTCKSPLCPLCAPKWQRTRTDEIAEAIDNWGAERVFFVTGTMRHHRGMRLAMMHRLLTHAWGHIWSGHAGQELAETLGGKPESIRAHDRTWSAVRGWHPHVHCLLFMQHEGTSEADLAAMLDERWPDCLAAALRSFRKMAYRVLAGDGCGREDCEQCCKPKAERDECPHLRERATRMFGTKLVPRSRIDNAGKKVPASLHDAMRAVLHDLKAFTAENIRPSIAHGVVCERVRDMNRLPQYLSKMGLELASTLDKGGRVGSDGIRHYGLWEVAQLACDGEHPLQKQARRAWSSLFFGTFGTQTITFSDREKLGLPRDPYAEDGEPAEAASDESSQVIFEIPGAVYRELAKAKGHALLGELALAFQRGELGELGYLESVEGTERARLIEPSCCGRP
jgi:hypothetical protein